MIQQPPRVAMLGELALRVNDLPRSRAFYRDVVGLEELRAGEGFVFFRVGPGLDGHPQALVLFDRGVEVGIEATTLDHFAFLIEVEDYEPRRQQLETLALDATTKEFPTFQWRAIFTSDPDGNAVEFVCHDPSIQPASP